MPRQKLCDKGISAYFLLSRTPSSASGVLLNKEASSFFNPKLIEKSMSHDNHAKSWRIIASEGLPEIAASNLDLNQYPRINPSWSGLQDSLSAFNSKLLMKH